MDLSTVPIGQTRTVEIYLNIRSRIYVGDVNPAVSNVGWSVEGRIPTPVLTSNSPIVALMKFANGISLILTTGTGPATVTIGPCISLLSVGNIHPKGYGAGFVASYVKSAAVRVCANPSISR